MKRYLLLILTTITLLSCEQEVELPMLDENVLAQYLEINDSLERASLIACAGGRENGLFTTSSESTSVFFYPEEGATDIRYFEAENIADSLNFSEYVSKDLDKTPIFNGKLWKFNNTDFTGERMGIITYKTPGKIHVCDPIRQKTNIKPTEVSATSLEILENGVNPIFTWEDGYIDENVIYFQVLSDSEGNFISGTYTLEKEFTFYDTSNVVLNITDPDSNPTLEPNQSYTFTMMAVSEDNWVNLFIEKEFTTN